MKKSFLFKDKSVIIILKAFALGGAEKQALFLANHLQNKLGCKVFIYSYLRSVNSKLFFEECERYKLNNLFLVKNPLSASGRLKYIKRRIKLARLALRFKKHKPDIIIPYLNPPSIIAAFTYKMAGAKVTFWQHRGPDYYRNDKLEKLAVIKTPFLVANSLDGKEELIKTLKSTNQNTFFLANFSTLNVSPANDKNKILKDLKGKIVIGMVAHFRQEKLQHLLVEAFHQILVKYNDIHLILGGNIYESGNELSNFDKVNQYINSHNLKDTITILHDKKPEELIPYFNIGILLSKKEGMPNVIMEYMAYNLPILCTKHAGCVSLLGNDYPFYIEDNNNIKAIASKLEDLIDNKLLRQKIGKENKEKLQKDFLIETYLDKLASLINKH